MARASSATYVFSRSVPADIDFLNREISQFLDLVTQNGGKLE
jgi:hypothetical protein